MQRLAENLEGFRSPHRGNTAMFSLRTISLCFIFPPRATLAFSDLIPRMRLTSSDP